MKTSIGTLSAEIRSNKKSRTASADHEKLLEIHERELRRNNVIIVGLAEVENKSSVDVVHSLFEEKLDDSTRIQEARRLGKPREGRSRPILVRVQDQLQKVSVLKKRTTLKGSQIFINDDLTPLQRKNHTALVG